MNQVQEFPHADKDSYIITRTAKPSMGRTHFYTDPIKDLISKLKNEDGKNIFIDGGAEIVNELLKEKLIDEFIISIIPVLVGTGTRLFKDGRPEQILELVSAKQFDKGLSQLHYNVVKNTIPATQFLGFIKICNDQEEHSMLILILPELFCIRIFSNDTTPPSTGAPFLQIGWSKSFTSG